MLPHLMMPKALLQHLPLLLYQMLRHHKLQLAQGDWCRSQRSIEHFTDSAESEHYNTEQVESNRHDTSKAQPGLYFLSDIGQLLMSLYIILRQTSCLNSRGKSSWVTSHPWFLYSIYDRITRQISWVTSHPWFSYSVYAKITRQISWVTTHPWFLYSVYSRITRQISWVTSHPWFSYSVYVRILRQIS